MPGHAKADPSAVDKLFGIGKNICFAYVSDNAQHATYNSRYASQELIEQCNKALYQREMVY